jgi:hypothetical protein
VGYAEQCAKKNKCSLPSTADYATMIKLPSADYVMFVGIYMWNVSEAKTKPSKNNEIK